MCGRFVRKSKLKGKNIDTSNARLGSGALKHAAAGHTRPWKMRQPGLSKRHTTAEPSIDGSVYLLKGFLLHLALISCKILCS
jgi:hypothetical protein